MKDIQVNYTPAVINIDNRKEFEGYINEVAKKYEGYVVTADTLKDDKKKRAEINKLILAIDEERKKVKREYLKPLTEFETWKKEAEQPLIELKELFDTGIKELENKAHEERCEVVKKAFEEVTANIELDPRIFGEYINEFAKAGNFNIKGELKPLMLSEIDFLVDRELNKLETKKKEKRSVSSMAFEHGFADTPYLTLLESGKELSEVLAILMEDAKNQKEKLEDEYAKASLGDLYANSSQEGSETILDTKAEKVIEEQSNELRNENRGNSLYPAYLEIAITLTSEEEKNRFKTLLIENGFGDYNVLNFKTKEKPNE